MPLTATATTNGQAVATSAKPGTFVPVRRPWHDGDRSEVKIPMGLRTETLPGDPQVKRVARFILTQKSSALPQMCNDATAPLI